MFYDIEYYSDIAYALGILLLCLVFIVVLEACSLGFADNKEVVPKTIEVRYVLPTINITKNLPLKCESLRFDTVSKQNICITAQALFEIKDNNTLGEVLYTR